ncbi:MAG: peptidoglycan-binding domain-containing protein [Pseudomonadales bacterium]
MKVICHRPLFALALAVSLGAGCASNSTPIETASSTATVDAISDVAEADIETSSTEIQNADELNTADETQEVAALNSAGADVDDGTQLSSDLFPPNAKPGHCYARVLTPAEFETTEEEVLKTDASYNIEIIPAEYEWVDEVVVVQEATTKLEVIPAKYETITEQVLVKPESKKIVEIPAVYRTEEEQVLDQPAHTIWKRTSSPADGALQTKLDKSTGEVVCLVEVPASYKTVKKTVLAEPARTEEIIIPAEYKSVTKTVEVAPATTREITIPERTEVVKQRSLVKPPQEQKIEIPATYETVVKRAKISEESLAWQEVLCEENMSHDVVADIQQKLNEQGYNSGGVDGILGKITLHAVNAYAEAKDLPLGKNYIAIETVESLGVSY